VAVLQRRRRRQVACWLMRWPGATKRSANMGLGEVWCALREV
jgi:hypothetical protein